VSTVNVKKPWLNKHFVYHLGEGVMLLLLVAMDQYAKTWAQMHDLVVMNHGGVLGIFPSFKWVGLWLIWLVILWEWKQMTHSVSRWGMGFLVAGGLSNLLDRSYFGSVRDYIYYPLFGFYGNVADILLGVGALILVGQWMLSRNDRIAS
jgi:lipoprotein signal peptidase